jgi:hypothetical protein
LGVDPNLVGQSCECVPQRQKRGSAFCVAGVNQPCLLRVAGRPRTPRPAVAPASLRGFEGSFEVRHAPPQRALAAATALPRGAAGAAVVAAVVAAVLAAFTCCTSFVVVVVVVIVGGLFFDRRDVYYRHVHNLARLNEHPKGKNTGWAAFLERTLLAW